MLPSPWEGREASFWMGWATTESESLTPSSALKRWSAIIRATAASVKNVRRASGDGPRWKNGGGSRVNGPRASIACEHGCELVHLLQRPAGTADDTGERVFGDDHGQARLLHEEPIQ